ncbi:transglycosylase SLT domain-containing protein [Pelagibacterium halotolerans]|nr:lytic transglycosylase domain-containing protein [Pelagibacterium halotolerans]QJR20153.1 transglycosylase SLT domain-containing protein [Pelagibacterium halotolerans]
MLAKRLIALFAVLVLGLSAVPANAQSHTRAEVEVLAQYYAQHYGVPLELVRRVINRESTFNPAARNGPYYGLMQILPETARTMGFRGQPSDLLNAETNLIYAVKYLRGAWLLANGSHDRAVQLYAKGYYYEAKAAGLLEETGLRPGPASPVAPLPPTAAEPVVAAITPPPVADVVETVEIAAADTVEAAFESTPLGFLPPSRPMGLELEEPAPSQTDALVAIAAAQAPATVPARPQGETVEPEPERLAYAQYRASSDVPQPMLAPGAETQLRPSLDLVGDTFALLDSLASPQR